MKSIYLAFCSVIPWGLEPQSKEPESFILSIELRDRWHKGIKKIELCDKKWIIGKESTALFAGRI